MAQYVTLRPKPMGLLLTQYSLCPLTAGVPIMGYAVFSLTEEQTASIPQIAMNIPDFDSYVSLQIFANSTQSEIGCFQAVMTNGNTVSLPTIIAPIVGVLVAVSIISSFVTATYGVSVPLMRAHYAHSLSVLLFVETLQSIFLTGALSLHWPSILVAWWSNFAWTVGLINVTPLIEKISDFVGVTGNASQVGGAGPTFINNGGGSLAGKIYKRGIIPTITHDATTVLTRRKVYNASDPYDYTWGGDPVRPGIPLPGMWQSFAGTLSQLGIPGASAFTLSLFWLVMASVAFPAVLLGIKGLLELLAKLHWIRQDSMAYFRTHYLRYALQIGLRTLLVTFSPIMVMAVFQFTLSSSPKPTALAAVVFVVYIVAMSYLVVDIVLDRLRGGQMEAAAQDDGPTMRLPFVDRGLFSQFTAKQDKGKEVSNSQQQQQQEQEGPFTTDKANPEAASHGRTVKETPARPGVHQDDNFVKQFGWLVARLRTGCWWFPAVYLFLQLIRACILGGGGADNNATNIDNVKIGSSGPPTAQVAALCVLDLVTLALYAYWRPFEGRRNMALGVWLLCSARVLVTVLCILLLPQVKISRIGATVVGFVILVIQVLQLLAVLVLVATGVITSWLSLTRNEDGFDSELFAGVRQRYLETLLASATGAPRPPRQKTERRQRKAERRARCEADRHAASMPPSFSLIEVRRAPKIEDLNFGGPIDDGVDGRAENVGIDSDAEKGYVGGGVGGSKRHVRGIHSTGTGTGTGSSSNRNSSIVHARAPTAVMTAATAATHNADGDDEQDTLGDLGDMTMQASKRRRANSGGFGSSNDNFGAAGPQIFDPSRVIARHNRSRTNSMNSLRSVRSTAGSQHWTAPGTLAGAGGSAANSPGPSRPTSSSLFPASFSPSDVLVNGRMTPTTAGPIADRMTPTRETLQRYASERRSLPPPQPPAALD